MNLPIVNSLTTMTTITIPLGRARAIGEFASFAFCVWGGSYLGTKNAPTDTYRSRTICNVTEFGVVGGIIGSVLGFSMVATPFPTFGACIIAGGVYKLIESEKKRRA